MSICDSMFPCDVDANTIHPALCFSHNVFAVANYRNISRWQCGNSKMLDQHVRRHAPASKHRMRDCRNNVHSLLTVYEDRRHKVVTHRPSSFTVCQWSTPRSTEAVLAALDGSTPFLFFYLVTQNWVFIIVVTSTIGPVLESTTPLKDWHAGAQGAHVMLDAYGCEQLPAAAIKRQRESGESESKL